MADVFESYFKVKLYGGRRSAGWIAAALLAGLVSIVLIQSAWQGRPITDRTVDLLTDPNLQSHKHFKQMCSTACCVHDDMELRFVDLGGSPQARNSIRVQINSRLLFVPGQSYVRKGMRIIDVNPRQAGFDLSTLAHEFGHHRNGDVYVSRWCFPFGVFQNLLFDWRIDVPIWFARNFRSCPSR